MLHAVAHQHVQITAGFWQRWQQVNRDTTLPIEYQQLRDTGRLAAYDLSWQPGQGEPPHIFWDSDVAKWLEAVGYTLASAPDPALEKLADEVIARVVKIQQPDGYLNVHYVSVGTDKRFTNLRDNHELYCAGHLIEAAVAYFQATGKRLLLDAMCRYADLIATLFGPGPDQRRGYPGHEEIELALIKLADATGHSKYADLARYFIDERGRAPCYFDAEARQRGEDPRRAWAQPEYYQAHLPLRAQHTAEGHAVRAAYLYSGAADVVARTGEPTLRGALEAIWHNIVTRRIYLTGGIGSAAHGERFTTDFDLPNRTAYAETCAAIGLVFWAQRMLLLSGDARYADVLERALYNGALAGIALDGTKFFYVNPLASRGDHHRQAWFGCACCPPNIARLLASVAGYIYATDDAGLCVNLFATSSATLTIAGTSVQITQQTDYPWDGGVQMTITPAKPAEFAVRLRIPAWAAGATLAVNGQALPAPLAVAHGYATVRRTWQPGDTLTLTLPMLVQKIEANPAVEEDAGRIALQRGPLVYCLESADNGEHLADLALPPDAPIEARREPALLGGIVTLHAAATRRDPHAWTGHLYLPAGSARTAQPLVAIPYYAWDNRAPGEMRVWIRQA